MAQAKVIPSTHPNLEQPDQYIYKPRRKIELKINAFVGKGTERGDRQPHHLELRSP
jgi:hypothetical protein